MKFLITILLIYVFIFNIRYSIFEIKKQENKSGGFIIICISVVALIVSNILLYIR